MPRQAWKKRSELFCGTKYWASPKGGDGVLITNNKTLLNQIPRNFWRRDHHNNALVIALATKEKDRWVFESGGFVFRLHEANVMAR
jgi:hypothetical protein